MADTRGKAPISSSGKQFTVSLNTHKRSTASLVREIKRAGRDVSKRVCNSVIQEVCVMSVVKLFARPCAPPFRFNFRGAWY